MLASYLSDRKEAVFCNNTVSNFRTIVKGVPQGSILDPLLFLVYVNDVCNVNDKFSYVLFADDINLLLTDDNLYNLHVKLNHELHNIFK